MKKQKWITTNIRLPEDLYTKLKVTAAKKRISLAQYIRDQLKTADRVSEPKPKYDWRDLIGSAKGTYGKTKEEIDAYIENERNSWD